MRSLKTPLVVHSRVAGGSDCHSTCATINVLLPLFPGLTMERVKLRTTESRAPGR